MSALEAILGDIRAGLRILASREFWRAYWAYVHPAAVAKRVEDWAIAAKERLDR